MKVITEINEETFPIGEVIRLGYNCVNVGEFLWETTKHEGDRVRGRFLFSQDKGIWSDFAEEGLMEDLPDDVDTLLELENDMERGK